MNANERLLVQYVLTAINGKKKSSIELTATQLNYLYIQGCEHQIQTLVFSALDNFKTLQEIAPDLISKWTKETIMMSCYQKEHIHQMKYILDVFKKHAIPVLALKGIVLRNLYPRPDLRLMGDADILVHEKDLKYVKDLLEKEGYQEIEDTHAYHVVFSHTKYMSIEVHWALTNHRSFHVPETISFEEDVWKHAVMESSMITLSADDHLIYICMHMAKHLKYAGFGLRQLCDFYLLLTTYAEKFNWQYLCQRLIDIGLYEFFAMQIAVCQMLFNYQLPTALADFPNYSTAKINLFINDLFQSGVFGMSTYYRSLAVTFSNGKRNDIFNSTSMWQLIFPKYKKLKITYSYLNKYPYLIIFAWFQHLYQLLTRTDQRFLTKIKALILTRYSMSMRKKMLRTLKLNKKIY